MKFTAAEEMQKRGLGMPDMRRDKCPQILLGRTPIRYASPGQFGWAQWTELHNGARIRSSHVSPHGIGQADRGDGSSCRVIFAYRTGVVVPFGTERPP